MSVKPEKLRDAAYTRVVKDAIDLFRQKERAYLLTYPDSEPHWRAAAHLSYYAELLFVLKGVKPCILFAHYTDPTHTRTIVETCLKPVLAQYDLLSYGFHLEQIRHPMPTTAHSGFQHGWVLADKHSARWDLVQKVFLRPFPLPKVPEALVGEALGYPTLAGRNTIRYIDETEREYLQKNCDAKECCCVAALEFDCGDGNVSDYMKLLEHYGAYAGAMKDVGRLMTVDTLGHPSFDRWMTAMKAHAAAAS